MTPVVFRADVNNNENLAPLGAMLFSPQSGFENGFPEHEFDYSRYLRPQPGDIFFSKPYDGKDRTAPIAPGSLIFPVPPRNDRHDGWPSPSESGSTRSEQGAAPTPTEEGESEGQWTPSESGCTFIARVPKMAENHRRDGSFGYRWHDGVALSLFPSPQCP